MIWGRRKMREDVELVSLHIPKTAGTSFRHILYQVYGEKRVTRLDMPLQKGGLYINGLEVASQTLPVRTRVIHGHFTPATLFKAFPKVKEVPLITWVRDPVERVISNYYYLEKRLREELDEEGKNLDILSKMQRSLGEYASHEVNRNRMSKFIGSTPLERFDFIGVVERMESDLERLSQLLSWKDHSAVRHNTTGTKRTVDPRVRERIRDLNLEDVRIYDEVLERNEKGKR